MNAGEAAISVTAGSGTTPSPLPPSSRPAPARPTHPPRKISTLRVSKQVLLREPPLSYNPPLTIFWQTMSGLFMKRNSSSFKWHHYAPDVISEGESFTFRLQAQASERPRQHHRAVSSSDSKKVASDARFPLVPQSREGYRGHRGDAHVFAMVRATAGRTRPSGTHRRCGRAQEVSPAEAEERPPRCRPDPRTLRQG